MMLKGSQNYKEYMPKEAVSVYENAINAGLYPADSSRLDAAVIAHFRLNPSAPTDIHDAAGGLYNRLYDGARTASSIESLIKLSETKKYTRSRIMRAVWYSYFGVTSSEIRRLPQYTQLLAANTVGRALLRRISKQSEFPVITKPSARNGLGDEVIRQKMRADTADAVYMLTLGTDARQDHPLTFTPLVKKGE
jgi:predicted nucleotidyltransferase